METQDAIAGLAVMGWVFTGLLLLFVVVCVAAGRGAIPLNGFVGIRVPALMRSECRWRAGHAAGQIPAIVAFAVAMAFSLIGLVSPLAYWGAIAALIGGLIWIVIRASKAANAV